MNTKNTCSTCIDSKCEVRATCPDDATTTERRRQKITPWPQTETTEE
jgi:hypothetical protein